MFIATIEDLERIAAEEANELTPGWSKRDAQRALYLAAGRIGIGAPVVERHFERFAGWVEGCRTIDAQVLIALQNVTEGKDPFENFIDEDLTSEIVEHIRELITQERLTVHMLQRLLTAQLLSRYIKEYPIVLFRGVTSAKVANDGMSVRTLSSWTRSLDKAKEFAGSNGLVAVGLFRYEDIFVEARLLDEFLAYEEECIVSAPSSIIRVRMEPVATATEGRMHKLADELRAT